MSELCGVHEASNPEALESFKHCGTQHKTSRGPISSAYLPPGRQLGDVTSITFHCLSAGSSRQHLGHQTVSVRTHTACADLCILCRLRERSSIALACSGEPGQAQGRRGCNSLPGTPLVYRASFLKEQKKRPSGRSAGCWVKQPNFSPSFPLRCFSLNIQSSLSCDF